MATSDTERSLSSVRISDLVSAVRGQQSDIAPERALNTLLHKRMSGKVELLQEVLSTNDNEPVRLVALRGLGMLPETLSRKVLTENLTALPLVEARAAVLSLGKIGETAEFDVLTDYRNQAKPQILPRIDASRRLIAFRHGLDTMPIKTPDSDQIRRPGTNQGLPMKVSAVSADTLKDFNRRLREEVPGIKLSLEKAVEVVCLKQNLWLMHNQDTASDSGIRKLQEKPQIPMVIMGYAHCSERPYLFAHVLSQPTDNGVELFVTRLNGEISHFGKGAIDGGVFTFSMTALKTRLAPAAFISGKFSGVDAALLLDEATVLADTSEQAELARRPTLVDTLAITPVMSR